MSGHQAIGHESYAEAAGITIRRLAGRASDRNALGRNGVGACTLHQIVARQTLLEHHPQVVSTGIATRQTLERRRAIGFGIGDNVAAFSFDGVRAVVDFAAVVHDGERIFQKSAQQRTALAIDRAPRRRGAPHRTDIPVGKRSGLTQFGMRLA